MNIKLLRRIQKKILAEPKRFQMYSWVIAGRMLMSRIKIPNCGTAACIAGWAVAMATKQKPCNLNGDNINFWLDSAGVLELDVEAAARLIHFTKWPSAFQKIPIEKEGTVAFAKQAAKRIDHFIKTKGAE